MQVSNHGPKQTCWSNGGRDWSGSPTGFLRWNVLLQDAVREFWHQRRTCSAGKCRLFVILSLTNVDSSEKLGGIRYNYPPFYGHISTQEHDATPKLGVSKAAQPASPREVSGTSCGPKQRQNSQRFANSILPWCADHVPSWVLMFICL